MGKISLAVKLADEIGVSVAKASRFIDDVGPKAARSMVDDAAKKGSKFLGSSVTKTAVLGGAVGSGALVFNEQETEQTKNNAEAAAAAAAAADSRSEAIQAIIESDLPPDVKQQMLKNYTESANKDNDGGNDNDGNGADSIIPDNPQTLIILLIVLAFAFRYTLGGDE